MPRYPYTCQSYKQKISDVTYEIVFSEKKLLIPDDSVGICSHPKHECPQIVIRPCTSQRELMITCLHELSHAGVWPVCESVIEDLAQAQTRLLFDKLKFRIK
jgi:hypothetical protein